MSINAHCECSSLEVTDIVRHENTLKAELKFYVANSERKAIRMSSVYDLNKFLKIQFKMIFPDYGNCYQSNGYYNNKIEEDFYIVFIRVIKSYQNDKKRYVIQFSSNELNISDKKITSDNYTWQLIKEELKSRTVSKCSFTIELLETEYNHSFSYLYNDTELTDFKLIGEDGSVDMHKAVIATSIPKFTNILGDIWTQSNEYSLSGVSVNTLQHLKKYVYLDCLPSEGIEKLLLLSKHNKMSELEELCIEDLVKTITAKNTYHLLEFAFKHDIKSLVFKILHAIQSGVVKMSELKNFLES